MTSTKTASPTSSLTQRFAYVQWLLPLFAILLYANTFGHKYTQDDAIVIYDNMYTTEGVAGIPGLLTKDTFHGFFKVDGKDKLVSGGRYRPLTPILFAIEYQLFGDSPTAGHILNALWYALLIWVLYKTLLLLFYHRQLSPTRFWLAVIATALFAAHPIHTEAVANIKGRDEILTLLGSLTALYLLARRSSGPSTKDYLLAALAFFLALMAKENAITYLAVIPLTLVLLMNVSWGQALRRCLPLLVATIAFIAIRTAVLGWDMGGQSMELMNNPFIKISNGSYVPFSTGEWLATILFTLGKYLGLLVFPHPLTHDYYPRHIDIMTFSNLGVWLSVLAHLVLVVIALFYYKKKPTVTWAIAYYFITLSIVSNIVFPIGTNMSERFLFMPSVGFAVLLSYLLTRLDINKRPKVIMGIVAVLLLAYSAKTILRNQVWKDDFTLFTTDVHTSSQSAKILNAAGGALSTRAGEMAPSAERSRMLTEAETHLKKAITIHPNYKNAYLLLGNTNFYLSDYDEAIQYYSHALKLDPNFADAHRNLAIAYRDGGRKAGEVENNLGKAKKYLLESYKMDPKDLETNRLLGVLYGVSQEHEKAIPYFEKIVAAQPNNVQALRSIAIAYAAIGNKAEEEKYMLRAAQAEQKIK